jgi:hypothetical protein
MYEIVDDGEKKSVNSYDSIDDSQDCIDVDDLKICSVYGSGDQFDLKSVRSKLKNPEYICSSCGRSASVLSSLCSPEPL